MAKLHVLFTEMEDDLAFGESVCWWVS